MLDCLKCFSDNIFAHVIYAFIHIYMLNFFHGTSYYIYSRIEVQLQPKNSLKNIPVNFHLVC